MKVPRSCRSRAPVGCRGTQPKAKQVAGCCRARCLCESSPSNIAGCCAISISLRGVSSPSCPARAGSPCRCAGPIQSGVTLEHAGAGSVACLLQGVADDVPPTVTAEEGHASRSEQRAAALCPQQGQCGVAAGGQLKRATACRSESIAPREKFHARKPALKRQFTYCDSLISRCQVRTTNSGRNPPKRQKPMGAIVLARAFYPQSIHCPATPDARP